MANITTLHGAVPYSKVDPQENENMTESKYLSLVLGPQRQDDQVGDGVRLLLLLFIFIYLVIPSLLTLLTLMRLFCRKDKLPQEIENSNSLQKNSYSFIHIVLRELSK